VSLSGSSSKYKKILFILFPWFSIDWKVICELFLATWCYYKTQRYCFSTISMWGFCFCLDFRWTWLKVHFVFLQVQVPCHLEEVVVKSPGRRQECLASASFAQVVFFAILSAALANFLLFSFSFCCQQCNMEESIGMPDIETSSTGIIWTGRFVALILSLSPSGLLAQVAWLLFSFFAVACFFGCKCLAI